MSKSPNDMANQALDTQNAGERENARDSEQTPCTHPKFLPVVQQAVAQALNQNKHSLPTNNDTITDQASSYELCCGTNQELRASGNPMLGPAPIERTSTGPAQTDKHKRKWQKRAGNKARYVECSIVYRTLFYRNR